MMMNSQYFISSISDDFQGARGALLGNKKIRPEDFLCVFSCRLVCHGEVLRAGLDPQKARNRFGQVSQKYPTRKKRPIPYRVWFPSYSFYELYGGPGRSPTCDLRVRSALLYATELPGHWGQVYRARAAEPGAAASGSNPGKAGPPPGEAGIGGSESNPPKEGW